MDKQMCCFEVSQLRGQRIQYENVTYRFAYSVSVSCSPVKISKHPKIVYQRHIIVHDIKDNFIKHIHMTMCGKYVYFYAKVISKIHLSVKNGRCVFLCE